MYRYLCQTGLLFDNIHCLSRYVTVEITPTAVTPWALRQGRSREIMS